MRIHAMTAPPDFRDMEEKLQQVRQEKQAAIAAQEFEKAASFRDKEKEIINEMADLEEDWKIPLGSHQLRVTEEEIADILSSWTGIPVCQLTEEESSKLLRMEDGLHERVVGQDEAVIAVSRSIRRTRAGLKDPKRPGGSFIFLGPSGVGKTELARTLAEFLFGDESALIQIDMSEYMEKHAVSRLVGSPPGYVGYEEGGQLTEAVRRKPFSVVLLDEIEKAHPDAFNMLLQILEDGRLTDSQGHKVDFRNTIIIMTSNLGARDISKGTSLGFTTAKEGGMDYDKMKDQVLSELKKTFRPELLNRIDDVIVFHELNHAEIKSIVDLLMQRVKDQLSEQDIDIILSDDAKEMLVKEGYDPVYGARPLRRSIQKLIEDPLSEKVLLKEYLPGSTILIATDAEAGRITFEKVEAPESGADLVHMTE
jgi:ATP-dependent Clp protease ATP-binding subunit ClpC